jgi:uncharacterized protein YlaN (UPF0358 family)
MNAEHGFTLDINGYRTTIEKIGKVWRAQVNNLTICSCSTRKATRENAEFLLRSQFAAAITMRIAS